MKVCGEGRLERIVVVIVLSLGFELDAGGQGQQRDSKVFGAIAEGQQLQETPVQRIPGYRLARLRPVEFIQAGE